MKGQPFLIRLHPLLAALAAALCACASAQSLDPSSSGPAFEDQLIDGGNLPPLDPQDGDYVPHNTDGLPRSWRLEFGYGATTQGSLSQNEAGISAGGFWETNNWGSFSIDGILRNATGFRERGTSGSLTIWQRQMPFDGGWKADNGLGVLNTPIIPLARNQYRFALPSTPMLGVESVWRRPGLEIQGGVGEPGVFDGGRWAGFQATGGRVLSVGAQKVFRGGWEGAISLIDTQDAIPSFAGQSLGLEGGPGFSGQSLFGAALWKGASSEVQVNLLGSRNDDLTGQTVFDVNAPRQAWGLWIDASTPMGRYSHHYGLFRMTPGLTWGISPFSSNVQGGYYRLDYRRARWTWNVGIDEVRSVDGTGVDGRYANGGIRYQYSPSLGMGVSGSVRTGDGTAGTVQVYTDKRTSWGTTRLQADVARDPLGRDAHQLTLDHAFPMNGSSHINASIAVAETSQSLSGETTRSTSFSLYGGKDLGRGFSADANMRLTRGIGPEAEKGFTGNVGLNWRVSPQWSLSGTFYRSQGSQRSPFILDPLLSPELFIPKPRDQAWFITMRYDTYAGQQQAVLGGAPGMGSGSLEGSVYLDENEDGRRNASEDAASNLTVVLDGRFSVRTDEQGRFTFPAVAVGPHTVAVVSDNLPLPWMIQENDQVRSVQVVTRGTTRLDIGARRPR